MSLKADSTFVPLLQNPPPLIQPSYKEPTPFLTDLQPDQISFKN